MPKCPHCGKEVELASSVKLKKPKEAKVKEKPKRVTKKEPSDKVKKVQPAITKPKEKKV